MHRKLWFVFLLILGHQSLACESDPAGEPPPETTTNETAGAGPGLAGAAGTPLASGAGGTPGAGGKAGAPGAGGSAGKGGAAGKGGKGGTGGADGTGGGQPLPDDCGDEEVEIANLPEIEGAPLWLFATAIALTPTTVYVGFHSGNAFNVDRIYAIPRCGGPPTLIASELGALSPSSMFGGADGAFGLNGGIVGDSSPQGALLSLLPEGSKSLADNLKFPQALFLAGPDIYFLEGPKVRRRSVTGAITTAGVVSGTTSPDAFDTLVVDGQFAYVSGPFMGITRVSFADGSSMKISDASTHSLTQDTTRLFAADLDSGGVKVIDKATGDTIALGPGNKLSFATVVGDSLFVASFKSAVQEIKLDTLSPVKSWGLTASVIAADEKHVFWSFGNSVWRGHR